MKKNLISTVIIATIFCLSGATSALANDDLKFSVGVKTWFAEWDTFTGGQHKSHELKNSNSEIIIPTATIKYKNFFINASVYDDEGFRFDEAEYYYYSPGTITEETILVNGERNDYDVTIGYYLIPQLALTCGYKSIEITGDYDLTSDVLDFATGNVLYSDFSEGSIVDSFDGFYVGATFASAFNRYFAGYGSFAYGLLDESYVNQNWYTGYYYTNSDSAIYLSSEVGVAYIPVKWASLSLAYRYQNIESKAKGNTSGGETDEGSDTMDGLMIGLNLTF